MKKRYVCLAFFLMLSFVKTYDAKCNDESIIAEANKITMRSEGAFADPFENRDRSLIFVENIPNDYFIILTNINTGEKNTFKPDSSGFIMVTTPSISEVYKYEMKVYSTSSECENELVRTETINSKVFNMWSLSEQCKKLKDSVLLENEYFDACEYFSNKIYSEEEFKKVIEERIKRADEVPLKEEIKIRFYKYYYFALIPMVLLGAYYIIKLIIIKKRKKAQDEE